MKVKVKAPAFCSFEHIDEDGYMTLPEGATLNDVYKKLHVPFLMRKILFSTVNYEQAKLRKPLKDGDVVCFIALMSGG